MATVTILRPDYEEAGPEAVTMAARRPVDEPVVVTVIENSKPHAKELLSYVAEGIRERLPVSEVVVHSKSAAGKPLDADEAEMLAARSHLVITGLGD